MNVQELYQKKLTTAAEAVKAVKSGDWVDYGWCTNHPYTLDKALAARQSELRDVKVRGGVTMWRRTPASTLHGIPGIAAASTARSSPRVWAISLPCATASCRASIATATPRWMWR